MVLLEKLIKIFSLDQGKNDINNKIKKIAPSGNRTRLPCLVGTDSTTKPKVLIIILVKNQT